MVEGFRDCSGRNHQVHGEKQLGLLLYNVVQHWSAQKRLWICHCWVMLRVKGQPKPWPWLVPRGRIFKIWTSKCSKNASAGSLLLNCIETTLELYCFHCVTLFFGKVYLQCLQNKVSTNCFMGTLKEEKCAYDVAETSDLVLFTALMCSSLYSTC